MDEIKLPPLPATELSIDIDSHSLKAMETISVWTENKLKAYARAAIEADRKRSVLGIAWRNLKDENEVLLQELDRKRRGEPVAPEGFRLIAVNETFDSLTFWLDRCEQKGHLENCADLVEPWEAFEYREVEAPQPAEPVKEVTVPDGWKLVPIEPTPEMRDAITSGIRHDHMVKVYQDMLEAAPEVKP